VSRYQKGKTNMDFIGARDSEWQWHQLGHMQICTSLQTNNHASTPPLSFFTGRMPFLPPNQQHQSTERQSWILHYYGTNAKCDNGLPGRKIGSFIHCRWFIGFRGQPHYCYRPFYLTARFRSPSSHMVSDEPFPDRSRPMSC